MQYDDAERRDYLNILLERLREVSLSVLPITIIVVVLSLTVVPIESTLLIRFLIGALVVVMGLGIFLFGASLGVAPIGNLMGHALAGTNSPWIVGILGTLLGFLITIAEPDLQILAGQVRQASGGVVSNTLILVVVSAGVGIMVAIGLLRILYSKPLNIVFTLAYSFIFLLGLKTSEEFLAISVDASGATTGAMATPFILALGYGVSQLKGGDTFEEDSFGLVGQASAGPIFAIMIMSALMGLRNIEGAADAFVPNVGVIGPYVRLLPQMMRDSVFTLAPLTILFLLFDWRVFKTNKRTRDSILKGLLYTFIGLTLFLTGVNGGFMEVGRYMGERIAISHTWLLPIIGFVLGMVVVLAEPAVYVLTEQIEEVTAGRIRRKVILIALSIGIALAVCMSMLRIMIPQLKLWHFLLPGFALGVLLSHLVPPIFVGIAFDAGGVASGPMTATFVLAFAQGAASSIPTASVMVDGFGVIAMVAMMPLVTIQTLGALVKLGERRALRRQVKEEGK